MSRNWSLRFATIVLAMACLSSLARPLLAQGVTADSIAIEIAAALHDTNVVSPITGARVPVAAVRLAAAAITGSNLAAETRLARALAASGTQNTVITRLLVSLSRIGADRSLLRVQLAEQDFNEFVNDASPTFLVNPPAEFLALHAFLVRISGLRRG